MSSLVWGEGVVPAITYAAARVPHPTLFGLLTALLAITPFAGAIAFCVAVLTLLASGSAMAAIIIVVLGFAMTFVANQSVRPALIGGAIHLPPCGWCSASSAARGYGLVSLFKGGQ